MREKNTALYYYVLTGGLCLLAAAAISPWLQPWQTAGCAAAMSAGLVFSRRKTPEAHRVLRTVFPILFGLVAAVVLLRSPLQQSLLPQLMRLFLFAVVLSCFLIENTLTMSLVHSGSIFLIIFSTCLPMAFSSEVQIALLSVALLTTLLLLQITHSISSQELLDQPAILSSVSLSGQIVFSLAALIGIILLAVPIFLFAPKFSFTLNMDRAGSSLVDFNVRPDTAMRLTLNGPLSEPGRRQAESLPYFRSVLFPKKDRAGDGRTADLWRQPLTIKEKNKPPASAVRQPKQNLPDERDHIRGGTGQADKSGGDAFGPGEIPLEKALEQRKEFLNTRIAQEKKMYDFLSYLGRDDSAQREKAQALQQRIRTDQAELDRIDEKFKRIADLKRQENELMVSRGPVAADSLQAKGEGWDGKGRGLGESKQEEAQGQGSGRGKENRDSEGRGRVKDSRGETGTQGDGKSESFGDGQDRTDGFGSMGEGEGLGGGQEVKNAESPEGEGKEGRGKGRGDVQTDNDDGTGRGDINPVPARDKGIGEGRDGQGKSIKKNLIASQRSGEAGGLDFLSGENAGSANGSANNYSRNFNTAGVESNGADNVESGYPGRTGNWAGENSGSESGINPAGSSGEETPGDMQGRTGKGAEKDSGSESGSGPAGSSGEAIPGDIQGRPGEGGEESSGNEPGTSAGSSAGESTPENPEGSPGSGGEENSGTGSDISADGSTGSFTAADRPGSSAGSSRGGGGGGNSGDSSAGSSFGTNAGSSGGTTAGSSTERGTGSSAGTGFSNSSGSGSGDNAGKSASGSGSGGAFGGSSGSGGSGGSGSGESGDSGSRAANKSGNKTGGSLGADKSSAAGNTPKDRKDKDDRDGASADEANKSLNPIENGIAALTRFFQSRMMPPEDNRGREKSLSEAENKLGGNKQPSPGLAQDGSRSSGPEKNLEPKTEDKIEAQSMTPPKAGIMNFWSGFANNAGVVLLCLAGLLFGAGGLYLGFCLVRKIIRDINLRYFCPGHRIVLNLYKNLVFVYSKLGISLNPSMTPREIVRAVAENQNAHRPGLAAMTDVFTQARYSNHILDETAVVRGIQTYNMLKQYILENMPRLESGVLWLHMRSIKSTPKKWR